MDGIRNMQEKTFLYTIIRQSLTPYSTDQFCVKQKSSMCTTVVTNTAPVLLWKEVILNNEGRSTTNIIKSKHRSRLTDAHLDDCLRAAASSYTPKFDKLADEIQRQTSH
ncbi:hypothetical protein L798_14107 [Zootermopsis nevadensis]|uniref:Uncharacterized protein n=1 Tax=Zootermopsis nevadensis TaxID=136037 RepID=A0A067QPL7_ZOONE|nr:hypothetical protein L798_14107 [Zootermopsis nevadensis]